MAEQPTNVANWLTAHTHILRQAGIESARLDCLILLEDVTGQGRAHLLAHADLVLSSSQVSILNKSVVQRVRHIPLAYIRGRVVFYGRDFVVNKHVLVPRPESEDVINLLLDVPKLSPNPVIADVGTGSGCLGITAALELPKARVFLFDISPEALAVAQKNAQLHRVSVHCQQQSLLGAPYEQIQQLDVVLANLPYVPDDYPINQAATFEPKLALFSGTDGLEHYRTFWRQVSTLHRQPAYVIAESLPEQHPALVQLAAKAGYKLGKVQGYVQRFQRS